MASAAMSLMNPETRETITKRRIKGMYGLFSNFKRNSSALSKIPEFSKPFATTKADATVITALLAKPENSSSVDTIPVNPIANNIRAATISYLIFCQTKSTKPAIRIAKTIQICSSPIRFLIFYRFE